MRIPHLPLSFALACSMTTTADAATVLQGGVARWSGLGAKACGFKGQRYPALDATCYYPVDLGEAPGTHEVALYDQDGKQHTATIEVAERICLDVPITLADDSLVKLDAEAAARHEEERAYVLKSLKVAAGDPHFSLPLAKPADPLPTPGEDFCEQRIFNDVRKSTHTGHDYAIGAGNAVKSPADGQVVLAADHLMTGKSVYVDHGGGLVSMFFHLDALAVAQGAAVKRGDTLGEVGATGRVTGPHLHFGVRWNGARIDPGLLLAATTALPDVADPDDTTAEAKTEAREQAAEETAKNEQDLVEEKDEATGD